MRNLLCFVLAIAAVTASGRANAEPPDPPAVKVNHLKIATSMFSNAQSWTDRQILGEYRLQNRPGSESWRVLGPNNKLEMSGTRAACEARMKRKAKGAAAEPIEGDVVVLVHGLFQTRAKMESIETYLKQSGKRRVINFGYASTKAEIDDHAAALNEVLKIAGPEANVSFVGHSMGCIVIRSLLAGPKEANWELGRVIMIGPPNQGAEMARRLVGYRPVRNWLGPGFEQLADPKLTKIGAFPAPPCEFAVIAGDSPKWLLNNPWIDGEDDWIVGVNETQLVGAKAQVCVPAHHGEIVHDAQVLTMIGEFLATGELSRPPREAEGK